MCLDLAIKIYSEDGLPIVGFRKWRSVSLTKGGNGFAYSPVVGTKILFKDFKSNRAELLSTDIRELGYFLSSKEHDRRFLMYIEPNDLMYTDLHDLTGRRLSFYVPRKTKKTYEYLVFWPYVAERLRRFFFSQGLTYGFIKWIDFRRKGGKLLITVLYKINEEEFKKQLVLPYNPKQGVTPYINWKRLEKEQAERINFFLNYLREEEVRK